MERREPRLSALDRQSARTFSDPAVATEWLATRAALRLLLERAAGAQWRGAPFVRTKQGRPHLEGAPVAFSVSHVAGLALIGLVSEGTIGVDLERARRVRVSGPRRRRIEEAGGALNADMALPDAEEARFLQAWVRLEAFAKADGCGIGRLLTRLGIIGGRGPTRDAVLDRVEQAQAEMRGAATRDLGVGEGLFAAVTLGPALAVPEISWLPASIDGLDKQRV
jgi:4'-phosphopantetheinyl transferase